MSFLELLKPLLEWRVLSNEQRRAGVVEYVTAVERDCVALVEWNGVAGDAVQLIQERLRKYYTAAATVFGDFLSREDREVFVHAVASARIYYWIRALEGRSTEEVERLIALRGGPAGHHVFGEKRGFSSLSVVERALLAYGPGGGGSGKATFDACVAALRGHCLSDIAKLGELRRRLPAGRSTG